MITRTDLSTFLQDFFGEEFLRKAEEKDELANGPQFLGSVEIRKIALGASINEDFLKEAVTIGANVCIFHHGFDPRVHKGRFPLSSQKRLRLIFKHDLTIFGFHYALDAHPTIGNNATILKHLRAKIQDTLFEECGFVGQLREPKKVEDLAKICADLFSQDVFAVYAGPKVVKTIGVVSGAAKPYAQHIAEMEEKGVELFIAGETSESVPNRMKESGINYFACGHYATEVFGVQELGKVIKSHFKDSVEVEFIDIPNPI